MVTDIDKTAANPGQRAGGADRMAGLLFRIRFWVYFAIFALGFWAPWDGYLGREAAVWGARRTWIALSMALVRPGWLTVPAAFLAVTLAALVCLVAAAWLRVWGTASLGAAVVHAGTMRGAEVVAAGPYRYVRNPLYLGTFLLALGVAILMPVSGAIFLVAAVAVFELALIAGEERFLARQQGAAYLEYKRRVPRLVPAMRPRVAKTETRPRWAEASATEIFYLAYAACFAALAWEYNAHLLVRALLICAGISIVARGMRRARS